MTRRCLSWWAIISLLTIAACRNSESEYSAVAGLSHPSPTALPHDSLLVGEIRMTIEESPPLELAGDIQLLRNAREFNWIGEEDSEAGYVFGEITDVFVTDIGEVYVLDGMNAVIKVFNKGGSTQSVLGRAGQGPSEFQGPVGVAQIVDGRIAVVSSFRNIKILDVTSEHLREEVSLAVDFSPTGVCVVSDRIIVQGVDIMEDGAILHAFAKDGSFLQSFGQTYKSNNPIVRWEMSDGPFACSDESSTILMVPYKVPVVYAYDIDGNIRWMTRIAEMMPEPVVEVVVDGQPGVEYGDRDVEDRIISVNSLTSGNFVFQLRRRTRQAQNDKDYDVSIHTFVVDSESGSGAYIGDDLPQIHYIDGPMIYTSVNDPVPLIKVFEVSA